MESSGILRRAALVRTDVSEKSSFSFFRVTRIGELATTRAVKKFLLFPDTAEASEIGRSSLKTFATPYLLISSRTLGLLPPS
jgi:hypothetical protein